MQVNQSIHRAALYSAACDRENRHEHYTDDKTAETEQKVWSWNVSTLRSLSVLLGSLCKNEDDDYENDT